MVQADRMLELSGITYAPATAGARILDGVSFQAQKGRPLLIAGASGSGKTSLLEIISGLASTTSGSIRWKGSAMKRRQLRWLCGIVFQFPERHFLGLSVAQELRLGHRRLGHEREQSVLKRVGLHQIAPTTAPERLSGGQQRRLALAVQMLRGAEVLLLDEPTAGLDWSVRRDVLDLLASLAREQVLIVVTHEPELFQVWDCQRLRLKGGQLEPMTTLP